MKKKRHQIILDIVREKNIENQDMLIHELRQHGIGVTQATVSRDISHLRLEKSLSKDGINCYAVPEQIKNLKFTGIFSQAVKSIDRGMNTVVIKTYSGMANAVCTALDLRNVSIIVGTIAGDDTVFALTRNEKEAIDLVEKLRKLL